MGDYTYKPGHEAVAAASELLDYRGMQARFQLALKDQMIALLSKEVALGLNYTDLGLGAAGFIAAFVTTVAMNPKDIDGRERLAKFIMTNAAGMVAGTDWSRKT